MVDEWEATRLEYTRTLQAGGSRGRVGGITSWGGEETQVDLDEKRYYYGVLIKRYLFLWLQGAPAFPGGAERSYRC